MVRIAKYLGMDPHTLYFERPAFWLDYGAIAFEQDQDFEASQRDAAANS